MSEEKSLPLKGIKILELGTYVAVPSCTRLLSDYGADVIKIEASIGDDWRYVGSSYHLPVADGANPLFTALNSNKKLISLNLKSPEGMEILSRLLEESDVFISNVRLKSLQSMGIDYEQIKQKYPRLIYLHFSGFGYTGPDTERPGYDVAAFWARTGSLVDWSAGGGFPIKPSTGFGDLTCGAMLMSGILMAIIGRSQTGKGTFISSSLLANGIWYNATSLLYSQEPFNYELPPDQFSPGNPFIHYFRCKDGEWINITVFNYDRSFPRIAKVFGFEHWIGQPDYCQQKQIHAKGTVKEIVEFLNGVFLQKTSEEWAEYLTEADVVYEILGHTKQLSRDPQAWANGYLCDVTFAGGVKATMPNAPLQFSQYDRKSYNVPTCVGENTQEVLASLGYSSDEIAALKSNGFVK